MDPTRRTTMTLSLGRPPPDVEAGTPQGKISFHDWIGDSWAVLFSHPKDFTPVCTTELGYMARIEPEFERRNVKVIGLSVDPMEKHEKWADDIEETQGARPTYPIIADADFNVSKLYEMLPASTSGDPGQRTPADNQTVRNVFVVGPDKKVKLILVYPMTTGRHSGQREAGRRRDHRRLCLGRRGEAALSRLQVAQALYPDHPATAVAGGAGGLRAAGRWGLSDRPASRGVTPPRMVQRGVGASPCRSVITHLARSASSAVAGDAPVHGRG